jgi:hypothetical protein
VKRMEFWKRTRFQKDIHLQNSSHVDEIMKNGRDNVKKILFLPPISLTFYLANCCFFPWILYVGFVCSNRWSIIHWCAVSCN